MIQNHTGAFHYAAPKRNPSRIKLGQVQQNHIMLLDEAFRDTAEGGGQDAFIDSSYDRQTHNANIAVRLSEWELLFMLHGQDRHLVAAGRQRVDKALGIDR